jgi:hypothetical protein
MKEVIEMKRLGIALFLTLAMLGGFGVAWAAPDPGTSPDAVQMP